MASSSDSDQPTGIPMSSSNITAPTPQNAPLNHAPITSGLSRPTVAAISEDAEGEEAEAGLSGSAVAGALQSMVTSRLGSLVGASSGYVESLPDDVKRSVEALKGIQTEQDALLNKFKWEALELERKVSAVASYRDRDADEDGRSRSTTRSSSLCTTAERPLSPVRPRRRRRR